MSRARGVMESGFEEYDFDITTIANFCTVFGCICLCLGLSNAAAAGLMWRERCPANDLRARGDCMAGMGVDIGGTSHLVLMHLSGFAVGAAVALPAGVLLRRIAHRGGDALLFLREHRNVISGALVICSVMVLQFCRCVADLRRAHGDGSGAAHVSLELKYDSDALLPRRVCTDARYLYVNRERERERERERDGERERERDRERESESESE